MNAKQFVTLALGSALLVSPALLQTCRAQDQDQESVVEAARKAQEAKKTEPKPKMVFDNDSLNTLKGQISVVGQQPTPTADETKAAEDKAKEATPTGDKKLTEADWRQKFADAYKKLADDNHELDVDQRDFNLKQQQFYTDPNAALKEQYSRDDLNDLRTKIDDLKAKVEQDKQDISDLQDALRQAGGDPGWANPPNPPATDQSPAAPVTPTPSDVVQPAPTPPTSNEVPPEGQPR